MTLGLQFADVWMGYQEGLQVLRGLSFGVSRGEIVLLSGENGAGKTTALSIASGDLRPDRGTVRVHGRTLDGRAPEAVARLGVRRLSQVPAVFRSLSIRDNVLLGVAPELYERPIPWPFTKRRATLWAQVQEAVLPLFTCCPFLDQWQTAAGSLSFGQQRIVDFIRVLAVKGEGAVLLLDEPFAGIHVEVVEAMWDLVQHRIRDGATVVMIEHQQNTSRFNGIRRLHLANGVL